MPVLSDTAARAEAPPADDVKRILRLEVPVVVRLASKRLSLREVMRLGSGAILEFDKRNDDPLELLINNKVIGQGEAVKIGENFGLRVTAVGELRDTIKAMGRR